MEKKRKAVWKPVAFTEDFLSKDIDGLVSIEELTDYNTANNEVVVLNSTRAREKTLEDFAVSPSRKIKKSPKIQDTEIDNAWTVSPLKKRKKGKDNALQKTKKLNCENESMQADIGDSENERNYVICDNTQTSSSADGDLRNTIPPGMEAWSSYNLIPCILQALSQLGFKKPTEIQALSLYASVQGRRDILGAAETGSGKTLAFGIPIIHGILQQKRKNTLDNKYMTEQNMSDENDEDRCSSIAKSGKHDTMSRKLFALVLTPTRELAIQVKKHLSAIAKFAGIQVAVVIGGLALQKQERLLKCRPEIVVATPGRLWELIESGNQHLQSVSDIRFLAIDETDRMLEKGHFQELQTLLKHINKDENKKRRRQNFVFSATLTMVHEPPKYISQKKKGPSSITSGQKLQKIITSLGIMQPKVVDITQERGTASTLTEARIVCPLADKDFYVYYFLLRHSGRTLVFCNSINCVKRLAQILEVLQCKAYPLHANMQQRQRLKNLERFSGNPNGVLLATDVAARGLDIPDVQHVIHFQVPRTSESYVHRSGRTARAKKEGLTVLIMDPEEVSVYIRLCKTLGRDRDLPEFPVDDALFNAAKIRVSLARQIENLEHILRKNNAQSNWYKKTAKDLDLLLDEDEAPKKINNEDSTKMKRKINGLKKELQSLIGQRVLPKTASFKFPNSNDAKLNNNEKAVEVVKNNVKNNVKNRSVRLKIFK